jgi:hypothetical protein
MVRNCSFFRQQLKLHMTTLTCLINEHPLIREQAGIFKKILNRADPNKPLINEQDRIFFKSAKRADPNCYACSSDQQSYTL